MPPFIVVDFIENGVVWCFRIAKDGKCSLFITFRHGDIPPTVTVESFG